MADTGRRKENHANVDWERLVIFSGVIMSAVLIGLIGVAVFAVAHDRPGAYVSIIVIVLCLLAFWAIVWGALWIVSGRRVISSEAPAPPAPDTRVEELLEENERLKRQLAELSAKHQ